jgi:tetratricopeptide (TPR) repeat protein
MRALLRALGILLAMGWLCGAARADDAAQARKYFDRGRYLYNKGDFKAALRQFERARAIQPLPGFDFHIGRCNDQLGNLPEAVAAYERYVAASDDEEVNRRLVELRAKMAAEQPEPAPPAEPPPAATAQTQAQPQTQTPQTQPAPPTQTTQPQTPPAPSPPPPPALAPAPPPAPPPAPSEPHRRSFAPAVSLGIAGLALAVVGVGLTVSVGPEYDGLHETCAPHCNPGAWHDLQARERAGIALLAIGGVALGVDVILWIVAARVPRERRVAHEPGLVGVRF